MARAVLRRLIVDNEWLMENGSDGSSPRKKISSRASLRQLMPAILDGPGDFAHPIRTGRNLVFKLDGRLDIPFVIPQQAQHLPDRRVPLAEGRVGAIMKLPIFQMHMRNPLVMPLDERDRGASATHF